jgi:hypothetical protein
VVWVFSWQLLPLSAVSSVSSSLRRSFSNESLARLGNWDLRVGWPEMLASGELF